MATSSHVVFRFPGGIVGDLFHALNLVWIKNHNLLAISRIELDRIIALLFQFARFPFVATFWSFIFHAADLHLCLNDTAALGLCANRLRFCGLRRHGKVNGPTTVAIRSGSEARCQDGLARLRTGLMVNCSNPVLWRRRCPLRVWRWRRWLGSPSAAPPVICWRGWAQPPTSGAKVSTTIPVPSASWVALATELWMVTPAATIVPAADPTIC